MAYTMTDPTLVTDPDLLSQLNAGAPSTRVTDPDVLSQLNQPTINFQQGGILPEVASDIDTGLVRAGQGASNFLRSAAGGANQLAAPLESQGMYNRINSALAPDTTNYAQTFNTGNNTADKLIQGAAQYAPYAAGGEALQGVQAASDVVPGLISRMVSGATRQVPTGLVYGATQSQDPVGGAIQGALYNAAGGAAGPLVGDVLSGRMVGNRVLGYLNKSSQNNGALSPQDTAENIQRTYTDTAGNPIPADIGTIANNKPLQNIYAGLSYIPGSGVSARVNTVASQLADNTIQDAQSSLNDAEDSFDAAQKASINQKLALGFKNQSAGSQQQTLQESLQNQQSALADHEQSLEKAPDVLSALTSSVQSPEEITTAQKQGVANTYAANKREANAAYEPINNANAQFDISNPATAFPNYIAAAKPLLENREQLQDLFGSSSDMGTKLNAELDKAQSLTGTDAPTSANFQDILTRSRALGDMAEQASSQGKNYESRLLSGLQSGLTTDLHNNLNQNGFEDLSSQLSAANKIYATKVVPFWSNPVISKTAINPNYTPTGASLAKALHNPSAPNRTVLSQIPQDTKNLSLYQLLSQGKDTSDWNASDIAANYPKDVDTRAAIDTYNPQANSYFKSLNSALRNHDAMQDSIKQTQSQLKDVGKQQSSIVKQYAAVPYPSATDINKYSGQANEAISDRYGESAATLSPKEKLAQGVIKSALGVGAGTAGILKPLLLAKGAAAALPAGIISRKLGQVLSNPELAAAYARNGKLPVQQGTLSKALNYLPYTLPNYLNQSGGQ